MPDSHLSQGTSLRKQHLRSFQRCFNLISFTLISKAQNHRLFCRIILQMCKRITSLSNAVIRLINGISKFSCCLFSVKIVCIRSDSVLKSRLFFAKCCHFCRCNTFKQKTAVWNLYSRSLFHFAQTRTEKFLQLTLVMKCRFFATSCVFFVWAGVILTFLLYCN